MQFPTLLHAFYHREKAQAERVYLRQPFGEKWEDYSWAEVGQMARKVATYLKAQNFPPRSNIGLVSKNCREWVIADLAIMMAGHVSVPFFATLTGKQIAEVLDLGDVVCLFAGKTEVWDDMKKGVPEDMPLIRFPHYAGNSEIKRGKDWNEILQENAPMEGSPVPSPDDLWTIIFTSGTTGTPKGVMVKHGTMAAQARAIHDKNVLNLDQTGASNVFFSFLPLNHVAERGVVECMCIWYGGSMAFTESIDRFAANLQDIRPTLFFAVPRIWTKLRGGVLAKMPLEKLNKFLRIPILSWYVKRKIAKGLGLDRTRINITGAAAIPQATKSFFAKIGLPLSEAYGMTENCATSHMLFPGQDKPGSVGQAQPGTECRIDPESGEVLTKALYTMDGYYKDEEKTAETITDGWLHTGDQGKIDEDGFLFLTGRVKDTFKTAKAKFIVPNEIEKKFDSLTDLEQMCLLGLGMPQPVLVVSLSELGAALPQDALQRSLKAKLDSVNATLASYKKVAAIIIAKEDFTVENGLLTPTLKVKRPQVHTRFSKHLPEWCSLDGEVIWE
ncbi:AMP-binding protein [Neolewinella agarilytica]|uniref:Long-chain acyl-CoA synthetase (AMP-forming) n=1 Tax=Neolewinella agarilytica TaxID=478744 RepID=A0A1H8ZLU9_9BACT|nr:AMP-binding protein [Neolewinella agarilytica]SEP65355.1 Long-chain acyl-CoA synthetase (AMP-forming) [Neolewinella agarilytica]